MGFDFPLDDWIDDSHVDFLMQKSFLFDPTLLKAKNSYLRNRLVFSCVSASDVMHKRVQQG